MQVPFFSSRPQIFAHRGGCDLGPENTITAFDIGMSTGADGLELDVHLSADGVVVVHHDRTLDRTTSGSGPLAAHTADELARLDAGYWFTRGGEYPFRGRGIGVPTLRDVLVRYRGVPTIIEIKGGGRGRDSPRRRDGLRLRCRLRHRQRARRARGAARHGRERSQGRGATRTLSIVAAMPGAHGAVSDLSSA